MHHLSIDPVGSDTSQAWPVMWRDFAAAFGVAALMAGGRQPELTRLRLLLAIITTPSLTAWKSSKLTLLTVSAALARISSVRHVAKFLSRPIQ